MTPAKRRNHSKTLTLLSLVALALLGVAGLRLLLRGFEVGDTYPGYSSLSAELGGTEVFYEALEALPGLDVTRSYGAFGSLRGARDVVIIAPGFSPYAWESLSEREAAALRRLTQEGARVVIAFDPTPRRARMRWRPAGKEGTKKSDEKAGSEPKKEEGAQEQKPAPAEKQFALKTVALEEREAPDGPPLSGGIRAVRVGNAQSAGLPDLLEWTAGACLAPQDSAWEVIYEEEGRPAIIQRRYGEGTLVALGDSYLLTNRAMRKSRRPEFLLWLLGGRRQILFRETQLGISDDPGVAWLARKYRLHGLFAALLVLLGLYVWRQSALPGAGAPAVSGSSRGDPHAGLVALLRRCVAPSRVLDTCLDEWAKTERLDAAGLERMREAARSAQQRESGPGAAPEHPGAVIGRLFGKFRSFAAEQLSQRRGPVRAYNEMVRVWNQLK
jgi:hypothetical protein